MLCMLYRNGFAGKIARPFTLVRKIKLVTHQNSRYLSKDHSKPALAERRHVNHPKRENKTTLPAKEENKVIFSGIQPTGIPHLGNYLGALRQWVKLQNSADTSTQLFFSIVDLHSLTARQEPELRRQSKRDMLAALLAVGIDPKRSTLFHQSSVPAHSELHWILSCDASVGWLSRMTQWKSKLTEGGANTNAGSDTDTTNMNDLDDPLATTANPNSTARLKLGLFSYPVLQAADVLLYRTTHVPVGEDQAQHIEFARDCAAAFNHVYGTPQNQGILVPPTTLLSPAKRVMSLADPTKKMSKSALLERSRILLTDSEEVICKKVRVALTDSVEGDITYDPVGRPGVSNLLEILAHLADERGVTPRDVAESLRSVGLRALKERVAEVVNTHLAPIRGEYERFQGEKGGKALEEVEEEGTQKARKAAGKTIRRVKRAIGIE